MEIEPRRFLEKRIPISAMLVIVLACALAAWVIWDIATWATTMTNRIGNIQAAIRDMKGSVDSLSETVSKAIVSH